MYKVFVIGKSKVGKTTFSKKFAKRFDLQHIQASEWIKEKNKDLDPAAANYRSDITSRSIKELKTNPNSCVDFIKWKYDLTKPTLIEGVRNPHDFYNLFDYKNDYVIFLSHHSKDAIHSAFDLGVDVIQEITSFLLINNLIENHIFNESFNTSDSVYDQALKAPEKYDITCRNEFYKIK